MFYVNLILPNKCELFLKISEQSLYLSVENLLEMGWVNVRNLLPNQLYENVLTPTELKRDIPVDRQRTVRVYSRERARVGGISVKVIYLTVRLEHLQVLLLEQKLEIPVKTFWRKSIFKKS